MMNGSFDLQLAKLFRKFTTRPKISKIRPQMVEYDTVFAKKKKFVEGGIFFLCGVSSQTFVKVAQWRLYGNSPIKSVKEL
jgi:hypothetical protein